MAKEAYRMHAYTDQSSFSLKCLECDKGLKGQEEAMQHMRETNHQRFGQIDR